MADRISPGRRFSSPAAQRDDLDGCAKLLSDVLQRRQAGRRSRRRSFRANMCSIRASRRRSRSSATEPRRRAFARAALMAVGLTRSSTRPGSRSALPVRPSPSPRPGPRTAAAVAPGPALTIKDPGPWRHLPRHQLRGQHGIAYGSREPMTPGRSAARRRGFRCLSPIQRAARRFRAARPCNWGRAFRNDHRAAHGRTIAGIPAGGPYFVSVRAANGTAYATLPSVVKVGLVFDLWGEGQAAAIINGDRMAGGRIRPIRAFGA